MYLDAVALKVRDHIDRALFGRVQVDVIPYTLIHQAISQVKTH